jgi:Fe-S cluster biosynthesis and repair protein YggX
MDNKISSNNNNNNNNNNNSLEINKNNNNNNLILNPFMQFCKDHIEKNNNQEFSLNELGKIWDSLEEEKKNNYINTYNKLIEEKKLNEKNNIFIKKIKRISVPLFNTKKKLSHGKNKKIPNSLNKKKPFYKNVN